MTTEVGASPLELLEARGRLRSGLALLGPAFVASVAYVDPGNFATNLQGGAREGYLLLWVVLLADLMAMLVQYLSAKLGIVTGDNLAEVCRDRVPRGLSLGLWLQAEVVAMATDVAEVRGAALGLNLLFHVPLFAAGLLTGVAVFALLALQTRGYRGFELAIAALLGLIFLGFLYQTLRIGPSASGSLDGLLPRFGGGDSLYLAVGIIGATVMPHVIYLHSALTQRRIPAKGPDERRRLLRAERLDVLLALGLAGLVNLAMLAVAAKLFHRHGHAVVSTIQAAHAGLATEVGGAAALAFAVALLASGVSSSSVGTYAGQVVMAGFTRRSVPLFVRRAVTLVPALVILAARVDPTSALVLSQVVLSFGIPFALVPLVLVTSRRDVMGEQVNSPMVAALAWGVAVLVTGLNLFLLGQQLLG